SEEVIKRLEVLVLMAVDLPVVSIHRQIASALNVIVQITRMPGGRRAVTQISEVAGLDPDTHELIIHDICNMRDGQTLRPTGYLPTFVESLIHKKLLQLEFLYGRDAGATQATAPETVPPRTGGTSRTTSVATPAGRKG
ncbi:MAG TPA: hypothetical protein DDY91_21255, partial [Planctomycetaceae bacterium]|nr:hypothetical protein [Planctomycetaceae bacterium]